MAQIRCDRVTGQALEGVEGRYHADDPAMVTLDLPALPRDLATLRWDGDQGLRPETPAEQAARETGQKAAAAEADLASVRAAEALVAVLAPKLGVDAKGLRDEVVAELTTRTRATLAGRRDG